MALRNCDTFVTNDPKFNAYNVKPLLWQHTFIFYPQILVRAMNMCKADTDGGIVEATLRPSDRAIDRSTDRATERPSDRAIDTNKKQKIDLQTSI